MLSDNKFNWLKITTNITEEQRQKLNFKRQEWIKRLNNYYEYSEKYKVLFDLKAGEIYEFDWGMNVGSEFSGRHFGIVLCDSKVTNPLVWVCPIKTNHKVIPNPYSDVFLGEVKGIGLPGSESVAVANQARALDKMRLFTQNIINKDSSEDYLEKIITVPDNVVAQIKYKMSGILF